MMEEDTNSSACEQCGDDLEYAAYVTGLQEGTIGGTGFVPIQIEWTLFCSKRCLREYLESGSELARQGARIP